MPRPLAIATVLAWMVTAAVSLAQPAAPDPHPLRPGDTSSPRDTLRDFLANANEMADIHRRDGADAAIASQARARALDAFDLSVAEYRSIDTHPQAPYPILLLHEILNRIEVPPDDQIPGDEDVAGGALDRWRIPDTRITIARVGSGPRTGEYLFTADTVSQLEAFYALVAHLPLRPGATPGIYDSVARDDRVGVTLGRKVRNRLKPVDASSPRSVLRGFVENIDRAHALVRQADAALSARPPTMSKQDAFEVERTATEFLRRSAGLLDLTAIPEAYREHIGLELALALKEVVDRVGLPPWHAVPDSVAVEESRRQLDAEPQPELQPFRWEVPNTQIEIVEVRQGERSGEFQFSARTVARIREFYDKVQDLPYRPGASEGFYEYYVSTPGYLVANASLLGRFVAALPDGLKVLLHGQTLWQWFGLALFLSGTALAAVGGSRVMWRLSHRAGSPYREWLRLLVPVAIAVLAWIARDFIDNGLNITGHVLEVVTVGADVVIFAAIAWAVFDALKASAELVATSSRLPKVGGDPHLIRIGGRILGGLLAAWVMVAGMRSLGADVVPLLAGLGIGGLAVALAAQSTLANVIGSLILFANKPVRVGDVCRYGDQVGTVEEIGLHSTRIRTPERTVVSVPNGDFVRMQLDNFAWRDRRLLQKVLHLRPETTPQQLRTVLGGIRELLVAHPAVSGEAARVRFVDYGARSKDVAIFAYLRCQSDDDYLALQEDLLLRMGDVVAEAGAGFAFLSGAGWTAADVLRDEEAFSR